MVAANRTVRFTVLRTDGTSEEIEQPGRPALKQLQALVGGYIERVQIDDRRILVVDEEGLLKDKPLNPWGRLLEPPVRVVGDAVLMMAEDFE